MKKIYTIALLSGIFWLNTACKKTYQTQLVSAKYTEMTTGAAEDSSVNVVIAPYKKILEAEMKKVLCYNEQELPKIKNGKTCGLADFITGIMQQAGTTYNKQPIDMAAVTYGGLRVGLPKGAIKTEDIFELMPFENELIILTLKAETVRKMFQYAASNQNLGVFGSQITIKGNILQEVFIQGKPLDNNKTYTLAVSDYLANGGDQMEFLKEAIKTEVTGLKIRDVVIESITELNKKGKSIRIVEEKRIIELN